MIELVGDQRSISAEIFCLQDYAGLQYGRYTEDVHPEHPGISASTWVGSSSSSSSCSTSLPPLRDSTEALVSPIAQNLNGFQETEIDIKTEIQSCGGEIRERPTKNEPSDRATMKRRLDELDSKMGKVESLLNSIIRELAHSNPHVRQRLESSSSQRHVPLVGPGDIGYCSGASVYETGYGI